MQFQTGADYAGLQKLRHFYFQLSGRRWLPGLFRVLQHAQGGADLQISRELHRKSLTSCKSCTLLYPFRLFTSPMLPNPAGKNLPLPNSQVSIIDFCNFLHFSILLSSAFLGRFYKYIKICRTFYCFFRTAPLERHIIATREDSYWKLCRCIANFSLLLKILLIYFILHIIIII